MFSGTFLFLTLLFFFLSAFSSNTRRARGLSSCPFDVHHVHAYCHRPIVPSSHQRKRQHVNRDRVSRIEDRKGRKRKAFRLATNLLCYARFFLSSFRLFFPVTFAIAANFFRAFASQPCLCPFLSRPTWCRNRTGQGRTTSICQCAMSIMTLNAMLRSFFRSVFTSL